MFCPPSEEKSQSIKSNYPRHRRNKGKKSHNKHIKRDHFKKKSRFDFVMSSWAENFTVAATWQLKHQLAHWKARAISLEFENKVLHDIIRKNNYNHNTVFESKAESDVEDSQIGSEEDRPPEEYEAKSPDGEDEDDFEVSEEFIEFLKTNAKYKEEARLERERLKALKIEEENLAEEMQPGPSESLENKQACLKELYGAKWQSIGALELSLQTQFMNESDRARPVYWPNIPFNFNFS